MQQDLNQIYESNYLYVRDTMLIIHFIGLAMGLGTSFTHIFLSKALLKLSPDEKIKFSRQTKDLSVMGAIGTILLLISGIYLIIPYWPALKHMHLLIAKLILFLFLVILILFINLNAKRNLNKGIEESSKGIKVMGKMTFLLGVIIVILAVMIFH